MLSVFIFDQYFVQFQYLVLLQTVRYEDNVLDMTGIL